jgi:hypothetical protein
MVPLVEDIACSNTFENKPFVKQCQDILTEEISHCAAPGFSLFWDTVIKTYFRIVHENRPAALNRHHAAQPRQNQRA